MLHSQHNLGKSCNISDNHRQREIGISVTKRRGMVKMHIRDGSEGYQEPNKMGGQRNTDM